MEISDETFLEGFGKKTNSIYAGLAGLTIMYFRKKYLSTPHLIKPSMYTVDTYFAK